MRMMNFKIYRFFASFGCMLLALLVSLQVVAQTDTTITGKVISVYNRAPLVNAVVSVKGLNRSTQTQSDGTFQLSLPEGAAELLVWMPGYFETTVPLLGRTEFEVTLVPTTRIRYSVDEINVSPVLRGTSVLYKRDFKPGTNSIEDAIQGQFSGLNIINKSGMPSEGSVYAYRGIRSFYADNAPLLVINGTPYLPDMENSAIIGGYSKSVFNPIHVQDIQRIRLLKGAETALYGSLGANGVLLVETSTAKDLETVIEFKGQYGIAYNRATLPVLGVHDFKSYIGDVGLTEFEDMGEMLTEFPFLKDDPNYYYNFLYNSQTDWQKEIYRPAFMTDNHLRVKGGDAIAKYDLSLGVMNQAGALDNSSMTRYSTRMNAIIALGKKFDLSADFGLSYTTSKLHEQGMLTATNPVLTALNKAPILSPYAKDVYNNELPTYSAVRQFGVSNPLAVLNNMNVKSDVYDVFVNTRLDYKASPHWLLSGMVGIYSSYNRQATFVPGLSDQTIVPLEKGVALNTARAGSGKTSNLYFRLNSGYQQVFGQNRLQAGVGYQGLITKKEFDAGYGRNTSSDFYKTLNYVSTDGRYFWGYNDFWNWMSTYGYLNYEWHNLLTAAAYVSVDGASSTGADAPRFGLFPGGKLKWHIANMAGLHDQAWLNQLDVQLGYALTGNSRYSSNLSKAYYSSQIYRQLSGIVVGNVPNTKLRWEDNQTWDVTLQGGVFNNRLTASLGYFHTLSNNLIQPLALSPIAGLKESYVNGAEIKSSGFELDFTFALVEKQHVGLTIGGNIATNKNVVQSLGGAEERVTELPNGSALISKVGSVPYAFYGYIAEGVIPSEAAANALHVNDYQGRMFAAGDVQFRDKNQDGIIDDQDRFLLGNALPSLYGGAFIDVRYKQLALRGYFHFSKGNEQYNVVRQHMEAMADYGNQSIAVNRRWKLDGQVTDMPKATYGDPMGNSRFSNRWIEDASFFRLSNLALTYKFGESSLKVLEGAELYLAGENLFTLTKYLGLDPVTAYSYNPSQAGFDYGNVALPRTFKMGINLTF